MQSKIRLSPEYGMLEAHLQPGESVIAESGAMVAMDPSISLESKARGGILKGLKRAALGGESFFQSTFTAQNSPGRVFLAPSAPGDILEVELQEGRSLLMQSGCYLASTPEISIDTKWGGARGFFSGTGMFLVKAVGPGKVWVTSFGALIEQQVENEFTVDTGHIVAFDDTLDYRISKVGGLKGLFFSGEGLVARFSGRGVVRIQTRNPMSLASFLAPYRPQKKSN